MTIALIEIASSLRAILEEYGRTSVGDRVFNAFPAGCCGNASELLGRYLIEIGHPDVIYVCGENGVGETHAWIETGGMVIDITADQFGKPPVIVTSDDDWYRTYWKTADGFNASRRPISSVKDWPAYLVTAWRAIEHGMGLALKVDATTR